MWDTRKGRELAVLQGHDDEVLDVTFDLSGRQIASASADGTAILWSTKHSAGAAGGDVKQLVQMKGHDGEVSKVGFSLRHFY